MQRRAELGRTADLPGEGRLHPAGALDRLPQLRQVTESRAKRAERMVSRRVGMRYSTFVSPWKPYAYVENQAF